MNNNDTIALLKFLMMEDLMKFRYNFDAIDTMQELKKYPKNEWPRYNPRKKIERYCLDLTGLPSGNENVSSLNEYNQHTNKTFKNSDFNHPTEIYHNLPTIKAVLEPFRPWLGRTHIIRIDAGGYFPPHYDSIVPDTSDVDIRLVAAINNTNNQNFKWLYDYDDKVLNMNDGELWVINTAKPHSLFSFIDDVVIMVANLKFDQYLFKELLENHYLHG